MIAPEQFSFTDLDISRKGSRTGGLFLAVIAALLIVELCFGVARFPPSQWHMVERSEDAAIRFFVLIYQLFFFILFSITATLAVTMRSRIALVVGALLVFMFWTPLRYLALISFMSFVVYFMIVATFMVGRGVWHSFRYHRLKRQVPVDFDMETFN
jgi:hypothetical protein